MERTKLFDLDELAYYFSDIADYETLSLASMINKHSYNIFCTNIVVEYADCMRTKGWMETPFQVACKKGYLDLAKDIIKHTTNISTLNIAEAFQQSCFHNQIKVIKWLHKIMSTNNLYKNDTIKISFSYIKLKSTFNCISCLFELNIIDAEKIQSELDDHHFISWIKYSVDQKTLPTILNIIPDNRISKIYSDVNRMDKQIAKVIYNFLPKMKKQFDDIEKNAMNNLQQIPNELNAQNIFNIFDNHDIADINKHRINAKRRR